MNMTPLPLLALALTRIEAKQAEATRLTAELRQIAGLRALGIVPSDIIR